MYCGWEDRGHNANFGAGRSPSSNCGAHVAHSTRCVVQLSPSYNSTVPRHGVVTLFGYGIQVRVESRSPSFRRRHWHKSQALSPSPRRARPSPTTGPVPIRCALTTRPSPSSQFWGCTCELPGNWFGRKLLAKRASHDAGSLIQQLPTRLIGSLPSCPASMTLAAFA